MKQIVLLSVLLSIINISIGQETSSEKHFYVGINFEGHHSYRTIKNDDGGSTYNSIIEEREKTEIPDIRFSGGISFYYQPNERLFIETGVNYFNKGYQTKDISFISGNIIDPRTGFTSSLTASSIKYNYFYSYSVIPLKVNYFFVKGRLSAYASAGVLGSFFINHYTEGTITYTNNSKETSRSNDSVTEFNPISVAGSVGVGIDYKITDLFKARLSGNYTADFTPIVDAPIHEFLYSTNIQVGIYYQLK